MRLRYVLFKSFSVRVTARVGRNDLISKVDGFPERCWHDGKFWELFRNLLQVKFIWPYCDRNPYQ